MTRPACFSSEAVWCDYIAQVAKSRRTTEALAIEKCTYCVDCSPEYKSQMVREGRCQNMQYVHFHLLPDDGYEAVRGVVSKRAYE